MHLSARLLWLTALVALVGIVGLWTEPPLPSLWRPLAGLLLLLLVAEGVWVRWRRFELARVAPARVALGVPFEARYVLANPTARPLRCRAVQELPVGLTGETQWSVCAAPHAHGETVLHLTPVALGRQTWPPIYARVRGPFGLAWWNRRVVAGDAIEVVPDSERAHERAAGLTLPGRRQYRQSGAGFELLALRDYRPGDPRRAIDWKASARSQRLSVRLFSEEQRLELAIAIDAGRASGLAAGELQRLHRYINVAARLVQRALAQGDRVSLTIFAEQPQIFLASERASVALARIRAALGAARVQARESNPLAALLQLKRRLRSRSLVVCFTELDDPMAAEQLLRGVKLLRPQHLPLIATLVDEEVVALRDRPARDWLDPYRSLAAAEALDATARTVLHLQRLGADVVRERPAQLDSAVLDAYQRLRARRRV